MKTEDTQTFLQTSLSHYKENILTTSRWKNTMESAKPNTFLKASYTL